MLSNKTLKHNKYQLITWHLNVKKVFIVLSGKSFQTTLKIILVKPLQWLHLSKNLFQTILGMWSESLLQIALT